MNKLFFILLPLLLVTCINSEKKKKKEKKETPFVQENDVISSPAAVPVTVPFWIPYVTGEIHYPKFHDLQLQNVISDYLESIITYHDNYEHTQIKQKVDKIRYQITFENRSVMSILFTVFIEEKVSVGDSVYTNYHASDYGILIDKNNQRALKFTDLFNLSSKDALHTVSVLLEGIPNYNDSLDNVLKFLDGETDLEMYIYITNKDLIVDHHYGGGGTSIFNLDIFRPFSKLDLTDPLIPYTKINNLEYDSIHLPYFSFMEESRVINFLADKIDNFENYIYSDNFELRKDDYELLFVRYEITDKYQLQDRDGHIVVILYTFWIRGRFGISDIRTATERYDVF